MFLQGLVWSQLKKMLVREGRSSRRDFVLAGVLPFFATVFGMLSAPAFPAVAEFGLVLFIAALFMSRAILAQAIRRSHDLGVTDAYLNSFKHQMSAYVQAFIVLVVITAFRDIGVRGAATVTSLVLALGGAAAITCIMVGGMKVLWTLATTIGELGPNEHGLPTEGPLQPVTQAIRSHPVQSKRSNPQPATPPPAPSREPRKTVAVPAGRTAAAPQPVNTPAPQKPPRIHKRSKAIGEW